MYVVIPYIHNDKYFLLLFDNNPDKMKKKHIFLYESADTEVLKNIAASHFRRSKIDVIIEDDG
jgi:hypothetical protein